MDYAEAWKISKNTKVPYTQQLVKNIRWSILTGEVKWSEKLPPIRVLASELGLSVNTVRGAYKQLEEQELIITKPHIGTIVQAEAMDKKQMEVELITSIKNALYYRLSIEEVRSIVDRVLAEAEHQNRKNVIFVYSEPVIGHRFAKQIEKAAEVNVEEISILDLPDYLEQHKDEIEKLDAIITTYFMYTKVRMIARNCQPIIYGMTVEVAPDVILALKNLPPGAVVAVVCKREESAEGFTNFINRLCPELKTEVYYEDKLKQIREIAATVSAVCISPDLAATFSLENFQIPILEMWDRINEQSMNMLRDYLN